MNFGFAILDFGLKTNSLALWERVRVRADT